MCQQLFLAAGHPLQTVEKQASLSVQYPYLGVYQPTDDEDTGWIGRQVRALLQVPYVYHLFAYLGCGCGFSYGFVVDPEADATSLHSWRIDDLGMNLDPRVQDLGYISVASLSRYLADNLTQGPLYIYSTWSGEEGTKPLQHYHTVTPTFFGGILFDQIADDSLFRIEQGEREL